MSRKWLLFGLVVSVAIHGWFLAPIFTAKNQAPDPRTVEVVSAIPVSPRSEAVLDPQALEPAAADEPSDPAPVSELVVEPEVDDSDVPVMEMVEEPAAPPVAEDLEETPDQGWKPDSPKPSPESTLEAPVSRIEPKPVEEPISVASVVPEESAGSATDDPPLRTESRAAALMRSRSAGMADGRETVSPEGATEPPGREEIARRISAARERTDVARPTSNVANGEYLSRQNGPERVVPQLEWRSLARWRKVSDAVGLRLISLDSTGRPSAAVRETVGGRWGRSPIADSLAGYSTRVRIVDHVKAFQSARASLRAGERLAILVPIRVERLMQEGMMRAIRERSLDPDRVAICSGVLEPGGRDGMVFRVDRVVERRGT